MVALANNTRFGLAAGVWTRDVRRAHTMARRLHAGTVWINTYRALAFNSRFGGYKNSCLGRVNGFEAVEQFLQTKSVWCELSDEIQDPFVLKVWMRRLPARRAMTVLLRAADIGKWRLTLVGGSGGKATKSLFGRRAARSGFLRIQSGFGLRSVSGAISGPGSPRLHIEQ